MKAVESLILEHRVIARLADALEAYARETLQGRPPEARDLGAFAAVFTDLAERLHHEKEEYILLPALVRHGADWDEGALAAVRGEHRQEAYLIEVLRQVGERAGSWNLEDRRRLAASAQALVDFQRKHHELEGAQVFPLVDSILDAAAAALLQKAIDHFDAEHGGLRADAFCRARALIERYAPARTLERDRGDAGPRDAEPRDAGPRDAGPRDAGPRGAGPGGEEPGARAVAPSK